MGRQPPPGEPQPSGPEPVDVGRPCSTMEGVGSSDGPVSFPRSSTMIPPNGLPTGGPPPKAPCGRIAGASLRVAARRLRAPSVKRCVRMTKREVYSCGRGFWLATAAEEQDGPSPVADEAERHLRHPAHSGRPMSGIGSAIGDAVGAFLANPAVGLAAHLIEALVILASPLLFPLAVVILRIVRPATFAAEHRLALVRESVLQADFIAPRCPDCRRVVEPEWILCPSCRQLLAHMCGHCGRTAELDWSICAWCGEELQWAGPSELAAHA